jgi:hypothetical protein
VGHFESGEGQSILVKTTKTEPPMRHTEQGNQHHVMPNRPKFFNKNRQKMIRIERGREVGPGIYEYRVWGHPVFGKSRQPLLDT